MPSNPPSAFASCHSERSEESGRTPAAPWGSDAPTGSFASLRMTIQGVTLVLFALLLALPLRAEDGYRLWQRYDPINDAALKTRYAAALERIVLSTPTGTESATMAAARD